MTACATPVDDETTTLDDTTTPGGCFGASAPSCLASCGQQVEVAAPTCTAGRWSCPAGIDSRVCCDPDTARHACPIWERNCLTVPDDFDPEEDPETAAKIGCPTGYTCVQSRTFPTPAPNGVCRLGELQVPEQMTQCSTADATAAEFLPLLDTGPVKVQGMLVIDTVCEENSCMPGDPCCNACYGSYRLTLDGGMAGRSIADIRINTEAIACVGSTCGIGCSPMQPGRRYVIWGTYMPSEYEGGIGQLYYIGHCPL